MPSSIKLSMTLQGKIRSTITSEILKQMVIFKLFRVKSGNFGRVGFSVPLTVLRIFIKIVSNYPNNNQDIMKRHYYNCAK